MNIIYTANWCSYCVAAKNFFEKHKIQYKEINIENENISREDLHKIAGSYTVPQIIINNKCIGGYDSLLRMYQNNELSSLINE